MTQPSDEKVLLLQLLRQYNERPQDREKIHRQIQEHFHHTTAILVLDASGFTRTTRASGIIHFLAIMERLQRVVVPNIQRYGGRHLKSEADNIFASFESVDAAVQCANDVLTQIAAANILMPADDEIYASFGIGYGEVLLIGDEEIYGDEMNLACKLGEDLAERGELLITEAAYSALREAKMQFKEEHFSISGLQLKVYRLTTGS